MSPSMSTLALHRVAIVARLRAAGCVFAEDEADLLISSAGTAADLLAMVDRRIDGLPLEHIVGWARFCGIRVTVAPGVFVPRARTELLVRRAAALAGRHEAIVVPLPGHLRRRVDVLVANVPYVPTEEISLLPPEARLHEARLALDGGTDGLDLLRRMAAEAPGWLASHGHLLVETSEWQASTAAAVLDRAGFTPHVVRDEDLDATVVIGDR